MKYKSDDFLIEALGFFVLSAITTMLITLKLSGLITWSWWWVTAPLWIVPVGCFIVGAVSIGLGFILRITERFK